MQIHLLGTVGYHPTDKRQTASFYIPEAGIALDAGTGFYRVRPILEGETLDIFISHAHLDHVVGLTFLLDIKLGTSLKKIRVYGEASKLASIQEHMLADLHFPAPIPIEWIELPPHGFELAPGCKVSWFPLEHPGGSVGYRFDWKDRSLAYVTDTTATKNAPYIKAIKGVDLLLHECNFTDDLEEWAVVTGHSCSSAVAHVAKDAKVGKLVIVHVNPLGDDDDPVDLKLMQKIFPHTTLGRDNDVVDF